MLQGWRFHVVGGDALIEQMMVQAGAYQSSLRHSELVIFSGGNDISPLMYGEAGYHPLTQRTDIERDRFERAAYIASLAKGKTIIGICRGAQLLNVLNGGRLWQNVDGHRNVPHFVTYTSEKNEKFHIVVTSDHHQMMVPGKHSSVWAVAGRSTIKSTFEEDIPMPSNHTDDPEIVFYPATRSLCFQPHPEWGIVACERLFYDCVKRITGKT